MLGVCRLSGQGKGCFSCSCSEVHEIQTCPTASDPLGQRLCPLYDCEVYQCGKSYCEPLPEELKFNEGDDKLELMYGDD
jgi:hypothetical protein